MNGFACAVHGLTIWVTQGQYERYFVLIIFGYLYKESNSLFYVYSHFRIKNYYISLVLDLKFSISFVQAHIF